MKPDAFPKPAFEASAPQTILIAGASGLIGSAFTIRARALGHSVRHLVRRSPSNEFEYAWRPDAGSIDPDALEGVDTVINLSGASISKMPWTAKYKAELRSSRLSATSTLVEAMNGMDEPPKRFLSGSAVGIYGNSQGDLPLTEDADTAHASGFLSELCRDWESAALRAERSHVTLLRTGLVLAAEGGMLPVVARITKLGGAGKLGTGRQHWPWISLGDYTAALMHLLTSEVSGPVNLTAPESSTAAEFMRTLANVLRRPYLLPAPGFALKAILGDAADELLLANQPAVPSKLLADGFRFDDVELEGLLSHLLRR